MGPEQRLCDDRWCDLLHVIRLTRAHPIVAATKREWMVALRNPASQEWINAMRARMRGVEPIATVATEVWRGRNFRQMMTSRLDGYEYPGVG